MSAPLSFSVAAPGKYLSMNDREHWRPRAGKVKAWRRAAYHAATALAAPTPADIHMRFDVTDRRRRDPHNLYPTVKALIDGMVDAGLWPDDTPEWITTHEPTFRVVPRGTPLAVLVTLTERAA